MSSPRKTLDDVLGDAQKWGTLGRRSVSETISHARQFLAPLEGCSGPVIDIGTGAGVPGLVIATEGGQRSSTGAGQGKIESEDE